MNTLQQMMGLQPQGIPDTYSFASEDPYYHAAMQGDDALLMQMQMQGVDQMMPPMEQPMGSSAQELTAQMLGQPMPQVTQADVDALAQALGIGNSNMVANGHIADPMYTRKFDILGALGGTQW